MNYTCESSRIEYLHSLVKSLADEVSPLTHGKTSAAWATHIEKVRTLRIRVESSQQGNSTFAVWRRLWARYHHLARLTGSLLNNEGTVASTYQSMTDFWTDMSRQERGETTATVWDSYEHGRRRQLESQCAKAYGAEAALLLNTGMAALLTALMASGLPHGGTILTGQRSYFETTQLLQDSLRSLDLKIVRIDLGNHSSFVSALRNLRPGMALLETAINLPGGTALEHYNQWNTVSPDTVFVIDNSVQSSLTRWFELAPELAGRLLVVESCVKYLTQDCMAGLIYGSAERIERCRAFARTSGTSLQATSFNYLRPGEVASGRERLLLHSSNVEAFLSEARHHCGTRFEYIGCIGDKQLTDTRPVALNDGVGAPVFLCLPASWQDTGTLHRELLAEWQNLASREGLHLPVRAGFGWPETTARVYESGVLNQADAPVYIRVSIGIEPSDVIRRYAQLLSKALERLCK